MDAYTGEIRTFAGNYAPEGWHLCDGATLQVSDYQALFSLIGVTWGGDGRSTFALPDLRGRLPIGQGTGQNKGTGTALTPRSLGQTLGSETVTVTGTQIPTHTHTLNVFATTATSQTAAAGSGLAQPPAGYAAYVKPNASPTPVIQQLAAETMLASGGNGPHDNLMPALTINFIICLNGIYPDRP